MAHRTTLEEERPAKAPKPAKKPAAGGVAKLAGNDERERIFDAFRRWGYLEATLDPLGLLEPLKHPALESLTGEVADEARRIYCGTVGADFTHCRNWIASAGSSASKRPQPRSINKRFERLIRADLSNRFAGLLSRHQTLS
jgi:2-oxoglutarate dehydrogenase E1 component